MWHTLAGRLTEVTKEQNESVEKLKLRGNTLNKLDLI
uniref:Uncharacterized protein n=1 Tax=Arundo donax TaxID=35708 RepID=A0A0A8YG16_ARUDO